MTQSMMLKKGNGMGMAKMPLARHDDMVRNNAGTIVELMALGGGKLSQEVPDLRAMEALIAVCRQGSTLTGTDLWADKASEGLKHAADVGLLTSLCRFCRRGLPAAEARIEEAALAASSSAGSMY